MTSATPTRAGRLQRLQNREPGQCDFSTSFREHRCFLKGRVVHFIGLWGDNEKFQGVFLFRSGKVPCDGRPCAEVCLSENIEETSDSVS